MGRARPELESDSPDGLVPSPLGRAEGERWDGGIMLSPGGLPRRSRQPASAASCAGLARAAGGGVGGEA